MAHIRKSSQVKLEIRLGSLGSNWSCPEEKARRNCLSEAQNIEIHERFGIAVPRPRGKPRGTQRARAKSVFAAPTEFFKAHGEAENDRFHRLWVGTAPRISRPTFFHSKVSGQGLGGGTPGGTTGPQRRTADADGAGPRPHGAGPLSIEVAEAPCQTNQTSDQTSGGSLVSWPRLPRFGSFPFRFPFRGEKGSAPLEGGGRPWHTSESHPR